jgi:hypothetical protein
MPRKEALPDNPCKEPTTAEATRDAVGGKRAPISGTTLGICAVAVAALALAIAFWPVKPRPGRPDMEGLLMSVEASDGRATLQPYDTYGIPMAAEKGYNF